MIRLFVLVMVGLMLALGLSFVGALDLGVIRIAFGHWLIESHWWVLLALALATLLIINYVWSLSLRLLDSKAMVKHWRTRRAAIKTQRGLIAQLEGNWASAKKLLSNAANKTDAPQMKLLAYLSAARAAGEMGEWQEAEQLIKQAYDCTSHDDFTVGLAQAQVQIEQNQLEQSLATLLRLRGTRPHHPLVLKLLQSVYLKLEDWQQLLRLLPELKKTQPGNQEALTKLEQQAWIKIFSQKTDELTRNVQDKRATEKLAELWQEVPEPLRFDSALIDNYARQLLRLGLNSECEVLLRKVLNKCWNDRLILLYGQVAGDNRAEQLVNAEQWLKNQPDNAALLLTLGRLALRNELWGKALEYFKASHRLHPETASYAELCRLSSRLGDDKNRQQELFTGLLDSLDLPKLPLPN